MIFERVAGLSVVLLIVPPPVQLQLVNVYPVLAVAVSVTLLPEVTLAEEDEADPPVAEFIVMVNVAALTVKVPFTNVAVAYPAASPPEHLIT